MHPVHAWVDGRLVDPTGPAVPLLDHGMVVGDGVFEATKIRDGIPFAMTRHLARMDRSLAGFGLPPADHDRVREGVAAVLACDPGMPLGKLRWWVTAGVSQLGSGRDLVVAPAYHVAVQGMSPWPASSALHVVPWTRNERGATAGLKTTSYADNVIALDAAHRAGADEAIFANSRGHVCEGTGSNVFVVVGREVLTPPLAGGALAGVTRALLMEWAAADGRPIVERDLPLDILGRADEVFITSSTRDVHPVHAIDHRSVAVGPITLALQKLFASRAAEHDDP